MIRVIGIGGEPASGKTTVMGEVMRGAGGFWVDNRMGCLAWVRNSKRRLVILGEYSNTPPSLMGADRLSMAAQPAALIALELWATDPASHGLVVLFEGDRLFNESFIRKVNSRPDLFEAHWIMLTASPEALTGRHRKKNRPLPTRIGQKSERLRYLFPGIQEAVNERPFNAHEVARVVLALIEAPFAEASADAPGALPEAREATPGPGVADSPALFM